MKIKMTMSLTWRENVHQHTPTVKRRFLLVTAAVWREPQLTVMISHDGETSNRAGNAWIDMNTSSSFSPSCGSSVGDVLAFRHGAPVQYSQCCSSYYVLQLQSLH